jgi:hypothetical protein
VHASHGALTLAHPAREVRVFKAAWCGVTVKVSSEWILVVLSCQDRYLARNGPPHYLPSPPILDIWTCYILKYRVLHFAPGYSVGCISRLMRNI